MSKLEEDDDYGLETDDEEDKASYKKGGYHQVRIGDKYNDRYIIESKLGWGHFSTVWLASDILADDDDPHKLVAIKVQKSESHYMEAALDEIDLLRDANFNSTPGDKMDGSDFVVKLLDNFFIHGPHGKHACLVFETMGKNTLSLIKRYDYRGIPTYIVKIMIRQLLLGLQYLHTKCQIIHTDLKPENFLLLPSEPNDYEKVVFARCNYLKKRQSKKNEQSALASDSLLGLIPAFDEQDSSLGNTQLDRLLKSKCADKQAMQDKELLQEYTICKSGHPLHDPQYTQMHGSSSSRSSSSSAHKGGVSPASTITPWGLRSQMRNRKLEELSPVYRALASYTIKIADLGNACWTHRHFTDDIATRQYRAPEVIVGLPYDTSVDLWAVACIVFELVTGDYLFDPKADSEGRHTRNEDHLALMKELLGPFPKHYWLKGKHSSEYFSRRGDFLSISDLQYWPLKDVFEDKYGLNTVEAEALSGFLLPLLELDSAKRATAAEAVNFPWLDFSVHDVAALYRDYNKLTDLDPSLALQILDHEITRAVEVKRYVHSTRYSATRLDRHLRRHCPYLSWLQELHVTVEAERARLERLVESGVKGLSLAEINAIIKNTSATDASQIGSLTPDERTRLDTIYTSEVRGNGGNSVKNSDVLKGLGFLSSGSSTSTTTDKLEAKMSSSDTIAHDNDADADDEDDDDDDEVGLDEPTHTHTGAITATNSSSSSSSSSSNNSTSSTSDSIDTERELDLVSPPVVIEDAEDIDIDMDADADNTAATAASTSTGAGAATTTTKKAGGAVATAGKTKKNKTKTGTNTTKSMKPVSSSTTTTTTTTTTSSSKQKAGAKTTTRGAQNPNQTGAGNNKDNDEDDEEWPSDMIVTSNGGTHPEQDGSLDTTSASTSASAEGLVNGVKQLQL